MSLLASEALDLQIQLKDLFLEDLVLLLELDKSESLVLDEGIDFHVGLPVDDLAYIFDLLLPLAHLMSNVLDQASFLHGLDPVIDLTLTLLVSDGS